MEKREGKLVPNYNRNASNDLLLSKLSSGQKQRLAIARGVLKNPEVMLVDKAISALNGTTERQIRDALEIARQGRITIVIA